MANVKKEMNSLRARFASVVEASGGTVEVKKGPGSVRCDYTVGARRQYVIWHYTCSDRNAPKVLLKKLREKAEILELCKQARKTYEIELIARVHDSAAWEAFEDWTETWLKDITAKIEAEVQGKSSD